MERVCVALRVRPLLPHELERGETTGVEVLPDAQVRVTTPAARSAPSLAHTFAVDHCFGPDVDQSALFTTAGIPAMCEAAFTGQAAAVMCFGQTGSGKTYTMSGAAEDGVQFAAARRMMSLRDEMAAASPNTHVTLRASYVELHSERIHDLLNGTSGLKCRWSREAQSFFVEELMVVECRDVADLLLVLREGQHNRHRGAHLLNDDSSRSHVLFTVYVTIAETGQPARHGKLTCVDLAGSERLQHTGSGSSSEGSAINRSLFALSNVVACLARGGAGHVPYRSSLLTRLLMDSLCGGCRALLIACVTPSARFAEESLRTIYFAQRAQSIRAKPVERVDAKDKEVFELKEQIRQLRAENAELRRALQQQQQQQQQPQANPPKPKQSQPPSSGTTVATAPSTPHKPLFSHSNPQQPLKKPSSGPTCLSALEVLDRMSPAVMGRPQPLPLGAKEYGFHPVQRHKRLFGT